MTSAQELLNHLKSILELLQEEKQALLHNDGNKVANIVKLKNEYIEKLSQFKGMNIENNSKVMNLIIDINILQETNLLLTKQALSFQYVLLESIAKSSNGISNTYSAKGNYESMSNIGLLDQSV